MGKKETTNDDQKVESEVQVLKKITLKAINDNADMRKIPNGFMGRIIGQASGVKIVRTQYGDSAGFTGKFMGVKGSKKFMSNVIYLPEFITVQIKAELSGEDRVESVNFAYDIYKVENEKSAVGYEYEAKPLVKPRENDVLSSIMGDLPALPETT